MSKEIKIKSNGLRNELKEIRKSIDKLTNVLCIIHDIKRTHNYESTTLRGDVNNYVTKRKEDRDD